MKPEIVGTIQPVGPIHESALQGTSLVIHAYCPVCQDGATQVYERDEGIYEGYRCERWHGRHEASRAGVASRLVRSMPVLVYASFQGVCDETTSRYAS